VMSTVQKSPIHLEVVRSGSKENGQPNIRFLQNVWYFAAWSADVVQEPLERLIIEQPVVLFRTSGGEVAALRNVCPHRFTPLSMGTVVGDTIECLYHGLRFAPSGQCVHNPHSATIPKAACVRQYPVSERDGIVWIWMGAAEFADESTIVRYPELNQPEKFTYTRGQTMEMPLNYELMTDNLMDLSHVAFTHRNTLGSEGLVPGQTEVREEGNSIWSMRMAPGTKPAPSFSMSGGCSKDDVVDYWLDIRWDAPANFYLTSGHAPAGQGRYHGAQIDSLQVVTPSSATQCYYFFIHLRNYRRDDDAMTQELANFIRQAFATEDEPMIASVQRNMGGRSLEEMKPVLLTCDAGAMRVRRARERLLDLEANGDGMVERRK
jgi:phenylpropionate dioxygenase-like ring-hydroxylating dioxygenase large terminal subunit